MFQVQFADAIRNQAGNRATMAVMAVGAITEAGQVNTILHTRRADIVALGRPHLWNPNFCRQASAWYDARTQSWPKPYRPGRDQAHRELPKAASRRSPCGARPGRGRTRRAPSRIAHGAGILCPRDRRRCRNLR